MTRAAPFTRCEAGQPLRRDRRIHADCACSAGRNDVVRYQATRDRHLGTANRSPIWCRPSHHESVPTVPSRGGWRPALAHVDAGAADSRDPGPVVDFETAVLDATLDLRESRAARIRRNAADDPLRCANGTRQRRGTAVEFRRSTVPALTLIPISSRPAHLAHSVRRRIRRDVFLDFAGAVQS